MKFFKNSCFIYKGDNIPLSDIPLLMSRKQKAWFLLAALVIYIKVYGVVKKLSSGFGRHKQSFFEIRRQIIVSAKAVKAKNKIDIIQI